MIIASFQTILSQEKNEEDLIISGKWHIEYIKKEWEKIDLPSEIQKMNWVIFHKSGKQEGMENRQKHIGKWEFDKKIE
jgi:hypothetical protein